MGYNSPGNADVSVDGSAQSYSVPQGPPAGQRALSAKVVDIRADGRADWTHVLAVFDACLHNHITQFSARTAPTEHK